MERGEFINAGVILFARTARFLDARVALDRDRVRMLFPSADLSAIEEYLRLIPKICAGGKEMGPIGELPQHERWYWLASPRSTMIQISETHSGICENPSEELNHLMKALVLL